MESDSKQDVNEKRIAKNTLMLYFRMLFIMIVSLFTSRVVLNTLGVTDYGIMNAVGGFVALFSILTNSMSRSISRFITFGLGKGDKDRMKVIFSTALTIQFAVSLIIAVLIETVGLWFLYNKMVIPQERVGAAVVVLHCSAISTILSLISVPYNAAIVAHERMGAFAYISILEVSLKLAIVYLLYISPWDKLAFYSVLLCIVGLIIRSIYAIYCKRHFEECTYKFVIDKSLLKDMGGFAGWTFLDNGCYTLNNQGTNVLMNLFFGVTMNTARGLASTVEGAVRSFVGNFAVALNPQIIKSYAAGNLNYMHRLICMGAKYSCFLILFFGIPICVETHMLLKLWLGIVPQYTVTFVRLSFILAITMIVGDTMSVAITATGKMRKYQIWNCCFAATVFPITYLVYKTGMPAYSFYLVYTAESVVMIFVRAKIVCKQIDMNPVQYYKEVLLKVFIVFVPAFCLPFLISQALNESVTRFFITTLLSLVWSCCCIFSLGMRSTERKKVFQIASDKLPIISRLKA